MGNVKRPDAVYSGATKATYADYHRQSQRYMDELERRCGDYARDIQALKIELSGYKAEYADNTAWIDEAKKTIANQTEKITRLRKTLTVALRCGGQSGLEMAAINCLTEGEKDGPIEKTSMG